MPGGDRAEFRGPLCLTTEILFGSMFGAADESGSRRYLGELAEAVGRWGVDWPHLAPFSGSRWSDGSGWGAIPTAAELASWQAGSGA